jgi:hypothetical protein
MFGKFCKGLRGLRVVIDVNLLAMERIVMKGIGIRLTMTWIVLAGLEKPFLAYEISMNSMENRNGWQYYDVLKTTSILN